MKWILAFSFGLLYSTVHASEIRYGQNPSITSSSITVVGTIQGSTIAATTCLEEPANGSNFIVGCNSNANVGINNSAPAARLHISSGTLLIDGNAANSFQIGNSSFTIHSSNIWNMGCVTTAKLMATAPPDHSATNINTAINCTDFDLYHSTGTGVDQWRNERTGVGP